GRGGRPHHPTRARRAHREPGAEGYGLAALHRADARRHSRGHPGHRQAGRHQRGAARRGHPGRPSPRSPKTAPRVPGGAGAEDQEGNPAVAGVSPGHFEGARMRFAIFTSMGGTTWNDVLDLWRHADQPGGWDAACVTDHFMPNTPDRVGDMLESWTALAALAGLTTRMRVGTIVSGNTYRHPAVLAKMAANIKVTLKVAARWADHWNVWGGPDILARKGKILEQHCAAVNRDPKAILRSAVMVPVISEDRAQIEKAQQTLMKRMGRDEASAKDIL